MKSKKKIVEAVTVLMPAGDAKRLKHLAIDAGRSTSAVVREALAPLLRKENAAREIERGAI